MQTPWQLLPSDRRVLEWSVRWSVLEMSSVRQMGLQSDGIGFQSSPCLQLGFLFYFNHVPRRQGLALLTVGKPGRRDPKS